MRWHRIHHHNRSVEAAELYGFDIQFTWNPTWLEYVGYTVMVPVDEHPSGVLHPPTLSVKDVVDEDGNIPDADAKTRCRVAEAAMLPAKTFNGNGTFFAMTFRIRKQPAIGEPDAKVALHIVSYSLALASGMSSSEAAAGPTGTIQPPPIDGTVVIHALVLTGPGDLNYDKVAEYNENDVKELMDNEKIIRHSGKIKATIFNAKKMVEIIGQYGSFANYLNSFPSVDGLIEKLQGYYGGFKGVGERNVYEFLKEIGFSTIKPDLQVRKVFLRLGLIGEKASVEEIVKIGKLIAEETNERPCTIDWMLWRFGSEICKTKKPLCDKCSFDESCSYRRNLTQQ